jgi:cysteine-S-conjugate beta-lyase
MKYDFNQLIDRENTNSVKWDPSILKKFLGVEGEDLLPLWVADMDFRVPECLIEDLKKRVDHGIFGYSAPLDEYYGALSWWQKTRHNWEIKQEWVTVTPGVVPALNFIIRALSDEGDKVIIQQPVYNPFKTVIENNNRIVVNNALILKDDNYVMDFEDLEMKAKDPNTKLLILCSPHNPLGRIWSREELQQLGEICNKHNVIVISDEIHNDLILPSYHHITYALLGHEFSDNSVICTAPSKTFNLAGLQTSNIIIPNKSIKEKIDKELEKSSLMFPNVFGIVATTSVYSEGGAEWLDQLLLYLEENLKFLEKYLEENLPQVKLYKPQGTYLAWLDFSRTNLEYKEIERRITEDAKVLLDGGSWFGSSGEGFMRINIACPRSTLLKAITRIQKCF